VRCRPGPQNLLYDPNGDYGITCGELPGPVFDQYTGLTCGDVTGALGWCANQNVFYCECPCGNAPICTCPGGDVAAICLGKLPRARASRFSTIPPSVDSPSGRVMRGSGPLLQRSVRCTRLPGGFELIRNGYRVATAEGERRSWIEPA